MNEQYVFLLLKQLCFNLWQHIPYNENEYKETNLIIVYTLIPSTSISIYSWLHRISSLFMDKMVHYSNSFKFVLQAILEKS